MTTVLRWTGLPQLISFYRYFAFSGPRVTTALGVVVLLGIAAIRLYWLAGGFPVADYPVYLVAYFALVTVAAVLACVGMAIERLAKLGWALGSLVSAASLAMYVVSRAAGLPGLPQLVGRWDYPLGTFAIVLAALFLGLHFSVLTGLSIAYPQRRNWHD